MEWLLQKLDFSKLITWLKEAMPSFGGLFDGLAGLLPNLGFGSTEKTSETTTSTEKTTVEKVVDNLNDLEKSTLSVVNSLKEKFDSNAALSPKLSALFVSASGELKSNADIDFGDDFLKDVKDAFNALNLDDADDATLEQVITGIFNEESNDYTKLAKIVALSDKVATLNQVLETPTTP